MLKQKIQKTIVLSELRLVQNVGIIFFHVRFNKRVLADGKRVKTDKRAHSRRQILLQKGTDKAYIGPAFPKKQVMGIMDLFFFHGNDFTFFETWLM